MIQRIQTLYLILSCVLLSLVFIWPLTILGAGIEIEAFSILSQGEEISDLASQISFVPGILNVLALIILFVSIFLFKTRKLQMRFVVYALIISVAVLVLTSLESYLVLKSIENSEFVPGISLVLLLVSIITMMMARSRINKDEKLVRAADRLR